MIISELLHKRILIKESDRYNAAIKEVKVLEISPSGNWTKLLNSYGQKNWVDTSKIAVIEILIDLRTGKPVV